MNIIFEGIDAVGKSYLIENFKKYLDTKKIKSQVIKEIEDFPLNDILFKMLSEDPFFNSKLSFKSSIYETFLLAADFFYKQEFFRNNKNMINLYDRDFLTLLCYQELVINKEYGEEGKYFFENFRKCIMFNLKEIDLLIYIKVPLEVSFKRIEEREHYILNEEQKIFLQKAKENFEKKLIPGLKKQNINIIEINGEDKLEIKLNKILKKVEKWKN